MSLLKMLSPLNEEQRKMRELVQKRRNHGIYMIGEGTVRMDSKKITESDEYKEFKKRMEQYAEG